LYLSSKKRGGILLVSRKERTDEQCTEPDQHESHHDSHCPPMFLPPLVRALERESGNDSTEDDDERENEKHVVEEKKGDPRASVISFEIKERIAR